MGSSLPTTNSSEQAKPVRGRPFAPGVSGNPAGRPRKLEALADAVRRRADPDELADIALKIARSSKSEAMRLQALQWLRDSGYARPASRHELAVETAQPSYDVSRLSLVERRDLLERIQALRAGGDGSTNRSEPSESDKMPQLGAADGAGEP